MDILKKQSKFLKKFKNDVIEFMKIHHEKDLLSRKEIKLFPEENRLVVEFDVVNNKDQDKFTIGIQYNKNNKKFFIIYDNDKLYSHIMYDLDVRIRRYQKLFDIEFSKQISRLNENIFKYTYYNIMSNIVFLFFR